MPSASVSPGTALNMAGESSSGRVVRIRLVFLHIGEIDTLNEKYHAGIYYEARWKESHSLSSEQAQLLLENQSVRLDELNSRHFWSPQLFIGNAIGQVVTKNKWYVIKKCPSRSNEPSSSSTLSIEICEHHRIEGVFWEKLELNHFPADVQDLTISMCSYHGTDTCSLVQDEQFRSSINREAFVDQQKWSLYEHVESVVRQSQEEYSFDDEYNGSKQKKHPVLSVTCRAARRPGYYYWNAFYLIFLITVCAFCIFSIPPDLPQNRLQITSTLLLTSVTFRWVVNRSLPTVYYLTTLDMYAITSIMVLVGLCIWHSVIASIIFIHSNSGGQRLDPTNPYVLLDRYVFIGTFVLHIFIHVLLYVWLLLVPYKRRREMEHLDRQYAAKYNISLESSRSRNDWSSELRLNRSSFIMSSPPDHVPDES